jgi:ribonucleoside-diphosphate reductase alpha chain
MFPKHIIDLLNQRYYLKGDLFKQFWGYEGQENWELLCKRVAKTISANNPARYDDYFNLMYNRIFLPNSPTLFGAGLPNLCLSACFVIPMEDSVEGWAKSFEIAMKVQTGGGGCGFPLHYLRPKGFDLKNKRAKAAGPIEFMKCWNQISNSFSQAVRNGANMGYLRCDHPDLEEFITCKETDGNLKNFNISIGITDEFIDCLRSGKEFPLKWNGEIIKKINTKEVWEKICKNAWKNGEPGILYHDRVQQPTLFGNNTSLYVNPCLHGDTLITTTDGNIPIRELVGKTPTTYDNDGDEQKITKVFSSGIKEVITLKMENGFSITCTPDHLFKTIENTWRKAENLFGHTIKNINHESSRICEIIPAGKAEVFDFTQPVTHSGSICGYITHNCSEFNGPMGGSCNLGSINMAHFVQDKTFDYQAYTNTVEIAYEFLDDLIDVNIYPTKEIDETTKKYRQIGLGNMGIADAFIKMGLRYGDEECCKFFDKVMKVFQKACDIKNKQLGELRGPYPGIIKGCNRNATNSTYAPTGSLSQIAQCSSGIEPIFSFKFDRFINGVKVDEIEHPTSSGNSYIDVTTNDLNYLEHMRIVSIAQKYITMSISKTVNLPESASVDDVTKCFMQSYDMGLKCITVYRDNSRENQTISTKKLPVVVKDQKFQRCLTLDGKTFKDKIGCGNLYITINWDEVGKIQELFVNPGKNGGCPANSEGLSRIISIALRNGVLPESIIEQLKGIKCHSCMYKKTKENIRSLSCPDSISRALSDILNIQTESKEQLTPAVNTCPLCSTELQQYGNCKKCLNCGWSKCG